MNNNKFKKSNHEDAIEKFILCALVHYTIHICKKPVSNYKTSVCIRNYFVSIAVPI